MLKSFIHRIFVVSSMVLVGASVSHAAVQGLYLFDTMTNPTPVDPPFQEFQDSSGNGRDIVKQEVYGVVTLDSDRPAIMPDGTFALNSAGGGSGSLVTGNTGAFAIANTDELTVEFWYQRKTTGLRYILEYGNEAANGWEIYEVDGVIHTLFRSNTNTFAEMVTPTALASDTWNHIAFTIANNGAGTLYINGLAVDTENYNMANFAETNGYLRLSAAAGATFSNNALFDELRISDVALSSGTGSGVGELAWNASLAVPEPTSVAAIATFATALLARRRKI